MGKPFKELFATDKPKSEWKKRQPDEVDRNDIDSFIVTFSISNTKDYTNTIHSTTIEGNVKGILNHFKNYFRFVYNNHYKPILITNNVKYALLLNPLTLGQVPTHSALSEKSEGKNSLIDRHLLSLLTLTQLPLSAQQIDKLTTKGRKEYERLLIELDIQPTE